MTTNERVVVDAHLHTCPACREETEAVRAMGSFLRSHGPAALPAHVPAPDLWERIEGKLVTETQERRRRSVSLRPVLLFAPALAAIIVAVVLLPKHQPAPESASSDAVALGAGKAATDRATESAKGSPAMIAMAKADTSRLSLASAPAATPAARRMLSDEMKSVQRRMRVVADAGTANRASESYAFRRTESVDFAGTASVSPKPRGKKPVRLVAQNSLQPKPLLGEITIVDVDATPAPIKVASAWRAGATTAPRPVAPASGENERYFVNTAPEPGTITVVRTDPGSGVSVAASYAAPPVTDTMIRQRQRRGLFGGYGAGGAAIGVVPLPSGALGTGSETGTP